MAKVLPILTFPAKSLKKPSVNVEKVTSSLADLIQDVFVTAKHANGIGLAAPQIGENINVLVMDVGQKDPITPEKINPHPICLINPRIIKTKGVIVYEEGCLSCPELLVKMERAENITVEGLDVEGRKVHHELSGLEAVCLQHEMDHLAGKLLVDRISRLKRDIYRKQLIRQRKDDEDAGDV